jgi:hypothetical protein
MCCKTLVAELHGFGLSSAGGTGKRMTNESLISPCWFWGYASPSLHCDQSSTDRDFGGYAPDLNLTAPS